MPVVKQRRVIQLDFVRGIAILVVLQHHFTKVPLTNHILNAIQNGVSRLSFIAVDLFFVLSGFLVGGLLVQELLKTGTIQVRRFLRRRALKIWPPYYVYILFEMAFAHYPWRAYAWQNLLNIQNYAGTILPHTWSLAVEEHFYLLLSPLLLLIYKKLEWRKHLPAILICVCAAILIGRTIAVFAFHHGDTQWETQFRLDSLLFGVILSYVLYAHPGQFARILTWKKTLLAAAVLDLAFATYNGHETGAMWSFGYSLNYLGMASILLLVYGYQGRLITSVPYKAIAWIGLYSYSIYLWHISVMVPVANHLPHFLWRFKGFATLGGEYCAAIALGFFMTKIVETPMLRLRERLMPRGPAKLAPMPPSEDDSASSTNASAPMEVSVTG